MGLKKNNPGCDCCDRVLVWDMGMRSRFMLFSAHETAFEDWSTVEEWLNEAAEKEDWQEDSHDDEDNESIVDYVLGSPQPSADFWVPTPGYDDSSGLDCLVLPDPSTQFDPETDGIDLGYWTGNIRDYKLIFWIGPLADENLLQQYSEGLGGDCGDDAIGCQTTYEYPDCAYVHGGLPSWWEEVENGTWQGRVVILLSGGPNADDVDINTTNPLSGNDVFAGTSSMVALFLNTLEETTGLSLDVTTRRTTGRAGSCTMRIKTTVLPRVIEENTCEEVASSNYSEPPGGTIVDDGTHVMAGVERLYATGFYHDIEGGEPLAVQENSFRDFCEEDDVVATSDPPQHTIYDITVPEVEVRDQVSVARNVLIKVVNEREYKVEFVMAHADAIFPVSSVEDEDEIDATVEDYNNWKKTFVQNLFKKQLASAEGVEA